MLVFKLPMRCRLNSGMKNQHVNGQNIEQDIGKQTVMIIRKLISWLKFGFVSKNGS